MAVTLPPPPPGFEPVATPVQNAVPPPPPGFVPVQAPGLLESFGRGAAEGATFGFDSSVGMDQRRREESRRANPWTHFAGEILGGAVPMVAAALLPTGVSQAAAAGRAGQLAARGAGLVRGALVPGEISTLGQAGLQGAKLGATYGGLSGAGHAEGDTGMLAGTARGALTGAALGVPLGVAGHGIYRGGQYLGNLYNRATADTATVAGQSVGPGALTTAVRGLERDRLSPQNVIDDILAEFPSTTATAQGGMARRFWGNATVQGGRQPWTQDQVLEVIRRRAQGETEDQISAAMRAANNGTGPGRDAIGTILTELEQRHLGPLNLVDRAALTRPGAGQNTQMTMRAAAATPGEHLAIAREELLERQVGAQSRLNDMLERLVGTTNLEAAQAAHTDTFQNAAGRLYTAAMANEQQFNLAPIFTRWEQQFDRMRGVIPDTVRARLRSMMWQETDQAGNVVRVPPENLQGFMYAREGLRDIIGDLPQGNNLRRHLTQMYSEMTDEVARTNPIWRHANNLYRDGMAGNEALEAGAAMSTRLNARSREGLTVFTQAQTDHGAATTALNRAKRDILGRTRGSVPDRLDDVQLAAATPAQRQAYDQALAQIEAADARMNLFRVGLARALSDQVRNQGETHDLTRQMLLPGARQMLRQVLGDEQAEQMIRQLRAEAAMHRTYQSQFGSQTTPLREAVDELAWAPKFEVSMMNPLSWPNAALNLAQEYAARTINARRNADLMRLYTSTDPMQQLELLRRMQTLHTQRSNTGNVLGQPVVGYAGLQADATAGERAALDYPRPPVRPPVPRP